MLGSRSEVRAPQLRPNHSSDPAAVLVHLLVVQQLWQPSKVAQRLSVPLAVVDECLATGRSTVLLRAQLAQWVTEARDVPHGIPAMLTADAISQHHADDLADDMAGVEDEALPTVGLPQGHMEFLKRSIGHNFTSILNDPNERDSSSSQSSTWSSWISDVFDYGTQQHPSSSMGATLSEAISESKRLLSIEPVTRDSFSLYLEYIGHALTENRLETEEYRRKEVAAVDGRLLAEEELPWPHDVPEEFFAPALDVGRLLAQVPLIASEEVPPGAPASSAVDYEAFAAAVEAVEASCQYLGGLQRKVEVALVAHVQNKSERFYSATALFDRMQADAVAALATLRATQNEALAVGDVLVKDFLEVAKLYRRQRHTEAVVEATKRVAKSSEQANYVRQKLLPDATTEDLSQAACTVAEAIDATFNCPEANIFVEVSSFRNIHVQLLDLKRLATEMTLHRAEQLLDVRHWAAAPWDDVAKLLAGAQHLGCVKSIVKNCQAACQAALWDIARAAIIEGFIAAAALNDANAGQLLLLASSRAASVAEKKEFCAPVRKLRAQHFLSLITNVTDKLLSQTAASLTFVERLGQCLPDEAAAGGAVQDEATYFRQLLCAAQEPVSMLLELREEENAGMRFHELEAVSRTCFMFSRTLEGTLRLSGQQAQDTCVKGATGENPPSSAENKVSVAFRAMLANQARGFFRKQHEKQQQKMLMVLSEEQWTQEERIDSTFQDRCNMLCRFDSEAVRAFHSASVDFFSNHVNNLHRGSAAKDEYDRKLFLPTEANDATPEGYVVGNSLLMLLQVLSEYSQFLAAFPFLAIEVITKTNDMLKLYDTQCAVLVLGASAVDQGKLLTIAIPHLALASQCLTFLVDLIPLLQNRLRATVNNPKMAPFITTDLDRVHRNITEHRNEFLAKMASMVREHIDSFPFDPAQWQSTAKAWIIAMLKEPARLIKQLKPLLRTRDQRGVVGPVIHMIVTKLRDAVERIPPAMMRQIELVVAADLKLLKLNADKFGFDAIRCVPHVAQSMEMEEGILGKKTSDEEFVAFFFSKRQAAVPTSGEPKNM
jgi:vacuolar protein sorting-associated protein 54